MANNGSIVTRADIDVSPEGVILSFTGLDADLVDLISMANTFEVISTNPRNMGSADIVIRSVKALAFKDRPVVEPPIVLPETP